MIIHNRAWCKQCNLVIESMHTHDFVVCHCGNVMIDGGKDYFKRSVKNLEMFQDLSEEAEE